jgi:hypothetical protein
MIGEKKRGGKKVQNSPLLDRVSSSMGIRDNAVENSTIYGRSHESGKKEKERTYPSGSPPTSLPSFHHQDTLLCPMSSIATLDKKPRSIDPCNTRPDNNDISVIGYIRRTSVPHEKLIGFRVPEGF